VSAALVSTPPSVGQLVKLSGTIEGLQRERGEASFVLTEGDRDGMGAVAIAAGLIGLGGQAISTASAAASAEETAERVSFKLGDVSVVGWLWRCPFREGDQVDVAAFWDGEHYQAQAVYKGSDGLVALYPHCSRGRTAHRWNAAKWWFTLGMCLTLGLVLFFLWAGWDNPPSGEKLRELLLAIAVGSLAFNFGFFGLMTVSLARKWMPFVGVAESAFHTLGWSNPQSIDLVKSSKKLRKPDDPGEYGTFYFRYRSDQLGR
jgi:hypothetical protein